MGSPNVLSSWSVVIVVVLAEVSLCFPYSKQGNFCFVSCNIVLAFSDQALVPQLTLAEKNEYVFSL